jgi:hypothetical protein
LSLLVNPHEFLKGFFQNYIQSLLWLFSECDWTSRHCSWLISLPSLHARQLWRFRMGLCLSFISNSLLMA